MVERQNLAIFGQKEAFSVIKDARQEMPHFNDCFQAFAFLVS